MDAIVVETGFFPFGVYFEYLVGFNSVVYYSTDNGEHLAILQFDNWRNKNLKTASVSIGGFPFTPMLLKKEKPKLDIKYRLCQIIGD